MIKGGTGESVVEIAAMTLMCISSAKEDWDFDEEVVEATLRVRRAVERFNPTSSML